MAPWSMRQIQREKGRAPKFSHCLSRGAKVLAEGLGWEGCRQSASEPSGMHLAPLVSVCPGLTRQVALGWPPTGIDSRALAWSPSYQLVLSFHRGL